MKKLLTILTLTLTLISLSACSDSAKNHLRLSAEQANKDCPVNLGNGLMLTSFVYESDANCLTMSYTYSEEMGTVRQIAGAEENQKQFLRSYLKGESGKRFLDALVDAGAGMKIRYKGLKTGETMELILSGDEIKEIADDTPDENGALTQLTAMANVSKSQCPLELDGSNLVMTDVDVEGDALVFVISYNPETYDFSAVDHDEMVQNLTDSFAAESSSANGKLMLGLLQELGYGVTYRYTDSANGQSLDFTIGADAIKSM